LIVYTHSCFSHKANSSHFAIAGIATVEMAVRPSVSHTLVLYQNEQS